MEIDEQKRTFDAFTSATKWSVIIVSIVLLVMFFTLV